MSKDTENSSVNTVEKPYCVYLTEYYGDKMPKAYIGSSSVEKVMSGYRGSVSSIKYKNIWRKELKQNPWLFRTIILRKYTTRQEALAAENRMQKECDVVKSDFFINQSFANKNGFFGMDTSGSNNPNYGKTMTFEQKLRHKKSINLTNQRENTHQNRSKSAKMSQNREHVKVKKSKAQQDRWKDPNSKLINSKRTWMQSVQVTLKDFTFISTKDFFEYIKTNKLSLCRDLRENIKAVGDWTLSDLELFTNLSKSKHAESVGINVVVKCYDYILKNNTQVKYSSQHVNNIHSLKKDLHLDGVSEVSLKTIIKEISEDNVNNANILYNKLVESNNKYLIKRFIK